MLQKLSYAFGNFAQGVGPAIVGGWLQYFYTKTETSVSGTVVGPGTALLAFTTFGTIAAGARLMESFANPVVGYFSDRIRTRFGRRRPFIVALTPVLALTFVGLWFPPFAVSGVGNAVWLGVTLGLFWLAFAGVVGPYLSLLPEITPYSRERIQVSTMMGYLEVAGFLAATMGAGAVIQAAASGVQLGPVNFSDGYQLLAVVVGVVILAGSLLSVRFITEKPHSAAKEVSYTFAGAIRRTFANELFLPYVAAVSLFRIGIDSVIVAIPFLVAVIVFGPFAVLTGLPTLVAVLDLSSALITAALVLTAAVVAFTRHADPTLADCFSASSGLARLSLVTLGATFVLYVSGILVAGRGSLTRCVGWPFWRVLPDDLAGWPQVARLALAVFAALLIVWLVVQTWRARPAQTAQRRTATLAGLAFLIEMAVGVIMQTRGSTMLLLMTYVAAGTVLFAALVMLAALIGLGDRG